MISVRNFGRVIGMLLLVHLVTGLVVPYVLLGPLTGFPAGFLEPAAGMEYPVRVSVLMLLVGGAVTVGIAVAAWPIFRQHSYALGLWLLALAVVNLTLQVVENCQWLSMLSLSQAYAGTGAEDAKLFQSLGIVVRSAWKWAHFSHILVVVSWILVLYSVLYRGGLVPRALAVIGLVASMLHIAGVTLPVFVGYQMPLPMALFGMPVGLANLALSLWLMAKGFAEPHGELRADAHGVEVPGA